MPPNADRGSASRARNVRLGNRRPQGHAARVGVLDDDANRLGEFERNSQRGVEIEEVGVPELLPLMNLPGRQERQHVGHPLRLLMRVLAVSQVLRRRMRRRERGPRHRPPGKVDAVQRDRDHPVVHAGVAERLLHQLESKRRLRSAGPRQLLEHLRIVRRVDDDEDIAEVLGCRPHQAGAANVDLLYERVEGRVGVLSGLGKGVKVHDHEIDRGDAMPGDRLEVIRAGPPRQDAGVDGRVQGLDPPVHHLGKAGHLGDANDGEAGGRQGGRGTAGRDEFDPEGSQAPAKLNQSGLVRNTQNCSHICRFT